MSELPVFAAPWLIYSAFNEALILWLDETQPQANL
jgi:hypothetical protein